MPVLAPAYRGPAVVLGVGGGFAFMGALPVAITLAIGVKTSATIIGMGFIGFGFLLIVPGICWCFVVQHRTYKSWLRRRRMQRGLSQEATPALSNEEPAAVELDAVLISDQSGIKYGGTTGMEYCSSEESHVLPKQVSSADRRSPESEASGVVISAVKSASQELLTSQKEEDGS